MTLQPHRHSTCHRHPNKPVTGFCTLCLTERLACIEHATRQEIPSGSSVPELRRTKSYCGYRRDGSAGVSEPRRKSCDVRGRSTLLDLFSIDDRRKGLNVDCEVEMTNGGFELREEDEDEEEIRVSENVKEPNVEHEEEEEEEEEEVELKTMKEHIDLEFQNRKQKPRDLKDIAGNLWGAAWILSKKLGRYRRKKNTKKCSDSAAAVEAENPNLRRLKETQSEVGEYGFWRRSCDTDPRMSVDAGRMSLDDFRYSFDEQPRVSWDGYLPGRSYPRLAPMVSVVEDVKAAGGVEDGAALMEERSPGGSALTKDYYAESQFSLRRRRSFDHSSLNRRAAAMEFDEVRSISNAKVSPETVGLFHGAKLLITTSNSLKGCQSGDAESASNDAGSIAGGVSEKGFKKLNRRSNMWNIWGLMQRRSESKCGSEERYIGGNATDTPVVESWPKVKRAGNGEASDAVREKFDRSYSSSARNFCKMSGSPRSMNGVEKRREDLVFQRSARSSPNNIDHGLLRFYLTPLRSNGRKSTKGKIKHSRFVVNSVL